MNYELLSRMGKSLEKNQQTKRKKNLLMNFSLSKIVCKVAAWTIYFHFEFSQSAMETGGQNTVYPTLRS